jgi:hypothetical protein
MTNSATQNPANKVGRNSGAGAAGISELVPSEAESRRGLEPLRTGDTNGSSSGRFFGLGAVALLGGGIASLLVRKLRAPRSRVERLKNWIGRIRQ